MTINVQIPHRSAHIAMSGRFDFQVPRDFKDAYTPQPDNTAAHEIETGKVDGLGSSALKLRMQPNDGAISANKSATPILPPDNPKNDGFLACKGRLVGELVECLTDSLVCPWAIPFGHTRFCLHEKAKDFVAPVKP